MDEKKPIVIPEENHKENSEQFEAYNQKRMLLMAVEEEKQKQEKMLAIESDVKNVERDMQDIQDLFRDLSKLVNVRVMLQTPLTLNAINCLKKCFKVS